MMPRVDPGSYRDHEGRVFLGENQVYRALTENGLASWEQLAESAFFRGLTERGRVVRTERCAQEGAVLPSLPGGWAGCLQHERIELQSYPYEWSFEMLKDAALLQLEILEAALQDGFTLKDATPYNVLFRGPRPVFIDIGSFEPWRQGEPWIGYGQFCELYLYPLLLCAYRDLPFQPLLRGSIDGIAAKDCARIFSSWRDLLRSGIFRDVVLHAKLQAQTEASAGSARRELHRAGFAKEMILLNVKRLLKIVSGLSWGRSDSEWADYAERNRYDESERQRKERFVTEAVAHQPVGIVWDLGANTGHYSRLIAPQVDWVVAMEGDHLAADLMYRRLREKGPSNVLPMVVDLADPSPALGWRHAERRALDQRQRPDLVLSLALIHHMVLSSNVPIADFVDWLASLGGRAVIEFVEPTDPMVVKLLKNKGDDHHPYHRGLFETEIEKSFQIVERLELLDGQRVMYSCLPRGRHETPTTER